jgi:putative FmdB family regulatory protein
MPTYDYKCNICKHSFELFQSMSAEPITCCPVCNGEVKRLIGTGAGTIFKGKGFYQTDYKISSDTSKKSDIKPESVEKKSTPKAKPDSAD